MEYATEAIYILGVVNIALILGLVSAMSGLYTLQDKLARNRRYTDDRVKVLLIQNRELGSRLDALETRVRAATTKPRVGL